LGKLSHNLFVFPIKKEKVIFQNKKDSPTAPKERSSYQTPLNSLLQKKGETELTGRRGTKIIYTTKPGGARKERERPQEGKNCAVAQGICRKKVKKKKRVSVVRVMRNSVLITPICKEKKKNPPAGRSFQREEKREGK